MGDMSERREDEASTHVAPHDELHRVRLQGATVTVTTGADTGLALDVGPTGLLVGSGSDCDFRLTDRRVSRRHLVLRAETRGVRVIDQGSRNGTFFQGAQVTEMLLSADATLTVGDTNLGVHLQAEPLDVPLSPRTQLGDAIAHSAGMRHVFSILEQAARTDATVLLEGQSGTGKDILAFSLHQESARHEGPFVVVDCGAIPEHLIESELFGHEKGAFTGAAATRIGAFEQAHTGTVFLDEIGELPLESQPKLLRALESKSFRRVGGSKTIKVDVRVVAATNRRLREAARRREFREDLYYRLAVVHVAVPRLADRREDIRPLAERFLRMATRDENARVPPELAGLLEAYAWPGNARELRNVVERFATFGRADAALLFGESSPASERGAAGATALDLRAVEHLPYHEAKRQVLDALQRSLLPKAIERAGGSIPRAAQLLGIPKASLYRMLEGSDDDRSGNERA
jgi:transcriptional regulator with PAS, ATPase and Fis domain